MLGNACGFRDFTCGGAAVVLTGEQIAGGSEQKLPRCTARPADPETGASAAAGSFAEERWGTVADYSNHLRWLTLFIG